VVASSIDTRAGSANDGQVTRSSSEGTRDRADDAVTPGQLSAQSWRELSVAPVLVTALSVYGAPNTPAQARSQLAQVAEVLPPQVEALVTDQLTQRPEQGG
jgi:hypothetical protein